MPTPDLAGFRDAQIRLIDGVGASVTFGVPTTVTWPASAAINPESGVPYDPRIAPASGGSASAVTVNAVISQSAGGADDQTAEAVGRMESADITLGIKPADRSSIEGATTVTVFGTLYRVREMKPLGHDQPDSYVVYAEQL